MNCRFPISNCRLKLPTYRARQSSIGNRSGFTITELLIVIGLIVLFIALAVPAFNTLRGSRSIEGAQTILTSMLDRARQEAIRTGDYRGVFVAPSKDDPQRTVLVLVTRRGGDFTADGGDPLDRYKPYDRNVAYLPGQRISFPVRDYTGLAGGRIYTKTFIRTSHDPGASDQYPTKGNPNGSEFTINEDCGAANISVAASLNNAYWRVVSDDEIEIVTAEQGGALALLPPGIGAQVINPTPIRSSGASADSYLRAGVILFNPLGKLDAVPYSVDGSSLLATDVLGRTLDSTSNPRGISSRTSTVPVLTSQAAVVIYDAVNYREQAGDGAKNGDMLYSYRNDGDFREILPPFTTSNADWALEVQEENWLTQNAVPVIINPQTGASTVVQ